ncbi:hypothetical protein [Ancylobacter novellus]|nr:hypothetical protein [Ancylobacter novellus]
MTQRSTTPKAIFVEGPRDFAPADIAAIEEARDVVLAVAGMPLDI